MQSSTFCSLSEIIMATLAAQVWIEKNCIFLIFWTSAFSFSFSYFCFLVFFFGGKRKMRFLCAQNYKRLSCCLPPLLACSCCSLHLPLPFSFVSISISISVLWLSAWHQLPPAAAACLHKVSVSASTLGLGLPSGNRLSGFYAYPVNGSGVVLLTDWVRSFLLVITELKLYLS